MITTITVENFKGVKRQKFVFNHVSAVVDEDAIARMRAVAKEIGQPISSAIWRKVSKR